MASTGSVVEAITAGLVLTSIDLFFILFFIIYFIYFYGGIGFRFIFAT
jgi:hypothetical protein